MCGIVACTLAEGPASAVLLEGLKRLEYRGYDSSGIAVLNEGTITTMRQVGKIENLARAMNGRSLPGTCGVGHTRWATHGVPSESNAHPHGDPGGDVVVVHNGIIENFRELREEIRQEGGRFSSETDSEVIAHLVARYFEGDLVAATRAALARLQGSYAIAVIHRSQPELVVGAILDSPLVVGVGTDASYLASDAAALLPLTRQVIYLQDGELAELGPRGVRILSSQGEEIERDPVQITWTAQQAEKAGFEHYMLKEIHEQPTTVSNCLLGRLVADDSAVALPDLGLTDEELCGFERVQMVACGTSWHAAHVARFFFQEFARVPVVVDYASEFVARAPVIDRSCLLLAISQSGETADTRAALKRARQDFRVPALCVCNVVGSSMAREADGIILTHAGPEIGVASTKAFMGQLVALLLLAVRMGQLRGVLDPARVTEISSALRSLPHVLEQTLLGSAGIRELADIYFKARDFLYIGRGVNYPIALEGALKLKEISYIHAEGYPAGEMKHGPIALIDEGLPILALATEGPLYDRMASNIAEARARGGHILAVVNPGDERVAADAEHVIEVPRVPEFLSPMVNVVPLQFLAYWIARKRGADVDQPRNLAKTVTVQ